MRIVESYPMRLRIARGRGVWRLLYPVRAVCTLLYGLSLVIRRSSRRSAPHRNRRLPSTGMQQRAAVVSIGNIEVGGGGKTPLALALGGSVIQGGGRPVVVTRGYLSEAERERLPVAVPVSDWHPRETDTEYITARSLLEDRTSTGKGPGLREMARILGDEVVLYRSRGVPVVIDRNRSRGIRLAEELFGPTHILLDDAFGHRHLHKDLDILLLDATAPFGDGRLVPLGSLREPPQAARRADCVVFTRDAAGRIPPGAMPFVTGKPVFFARHRPAELISRSHERLSLSELTGREVALYSGIARPSSFEGLVRELGANVHSSFRFIDHHRYDLRDIEWIASQVPAGTPFLTTEKDWAKSAEYFPGTVEIYMLRIVMEVDGIEDLLRLIPSRSAS
ncbi:MAG: tetraacyldisaccharide 4'-kinase [bacterium]|nr:MAG: tetraacyldisaccharide 4'-kinase [bacterium]